jgi:hypothetical protein
MSVTGLGMDKPFNLLNNIVFSHFHVIDDKTELRMLSKFAQISELNEKQNTNLKVVRQNLTYMFS